MKTNPLWKSHFLLPMLLRACVILHPHFITNIDHPEKLSACQESLSQAIPCKFCAYGAYTLLLYESAAPLLSRITGDLRWRYYLTMALELLPPGHFQGTELLSKPNLRILVVISMYLGCRLIYPSAWHALSTRLFFSYRAGRS